MVEKNAKAKPKSTPVGRRSPRKGGTSSDKAAATTTQKATADLRAPKVRSRESRPTPRSPAAAAKRNKDGRGESTTSGSRSGRTQAGNSNPSPKTTRSGKTRNAPAAATPPDHVSESEAVDDEDLEDEGESGEGDSNEDTDDIEETQGEGGEEVEKEDVNAAAATGSNAAPGEGGEEEEKEDANAATTGPTGAPGGPTPPPTNEQLLAMMAKMEALQTKVDLQARAMSAKMPGPGGKSTKGWMMDQRLAAYDNMRDTAPVL